MIFYSPVYNFFYKLPELSFYIPLFYPLSPCHPAILQYYPLSPCHPAILQYLCAFILGTLPIC